jgi:PPOX class probable F420-dependent enzyme
MNGGDAMPTPETHAILQTNPVAQQLLQSAIPARLAYTWHDGTPRVVPMWFHWTGEDLVMGAPPNAPKMRALADHPDVAVTIDSNEWPYQVLTIRGTATVTEVEGFFPEYAAMARRYLGAAGSEQFMGLATQRFTRWARITIRPEEVRLLDFRTDLPSAWTASSGSS